jgi:hypothetical protein
MGIRRLIPLGAVVLLSLVLAAPAWGAARTWLQVSPNPSYVPKGGLLLEVHGKAFTITSANGGGVTSFTSNQPVQATLRSFSDCTVVLKLTLQPGTLTAIDLNADGSTRVTDYTDSDLDAGPALQSGPDACGTPPDTSMAESAPSREPFPPLAVVGALTVVGLLTMRLRSRRLARNSV